MSSCYCGQGKLDRSKREAEVSFGLFWIHFGKRLLIYLHHHVITCCRRNCPITAPKEKSATPIRSAAGKSVAGWQLAWSFWQFDCRIISQGTISSAGLGRQQRILQRLTLRRYWFAAKQLAPVSQIHYSAHAPVEQGKRDACWYSCGTAGGCRIFIQPSRSAWLLSFFGCDGFGTQQDPSGLLAARLSCS